VPANLAGSYVVMFDPLDGSSNIDANVSIGTIFAIYRRNSKDGLVDADVLRPGREQVAAGYVLYGSSTVFVLTDGHTVDAFTLDPASGEYFLTRENIRMPDKTKVLSINECNEPYWPAWVKPYLDEVKGRNTEETRHVSARHIGSLVADFHRNLIYGGIYMYPADTRGKAKLRVLYECNPLAFIAEVAGGSAHADGLGPVLDIQPKALHDRCGLVIGGKTEVAAVLGDDQEVLVARLSVLGAPSAEGHVQHRRDEHEAAAEDVHGRAGPARAEDRGYTEGRHHEHDRGHGQRGRARHGGGEPARSSPGRVLEPSREEDIPAREGAERRQYADRDLRGRGEGLGRLSHRRLLRMGTGSLPCYGTASMTVCPSGTFIHMAAC
jgi:fructose-1,6-bisphosphatase